MKIEMEFQGLKELMKAFEDAASDEDIRAVNKKIVEQGEPVVKRIMSGKIPKSADIKLSGRGFGSKSSVTSHAEKLLNIVEVEQVEKEKSAFDEYDRENGYEDEPEEPEENQWKVCGEIVDRVVKIAIRLLKNSYSQCMKENIVTLLEYLRFELDTINENQ